MTIFESIRGKPGQKLPPLQAPDIARRLQSAEAELAELERQHGDAALEALTGDESATAHLDDLQSRTAKAREHVSTLRAAHGAALERDAAALRAQRAALRKTQRLALAKHLESRTKAAERLSGLLVEVVREYHAMLDHSAKAIAATPIGSTFPDGSLCPAGEVKRQVSAELFRLSSPGDSINGDKMRVFPGAACPSTDYLDQPGAIEPLIAKMRADTAAVLAQVDSQAD